MDDGKRLDALDVVYHVYYVLRGGVRGGEWSKILSDWRVADYFLGSLGHYFRCLFRMFF